MGEFTETWFPVWLSEQVVPRSRVSGTVGEEVTSLYAVLACSLPPPWPLVMVGHLSWGHMKDTGSLPRVQRRAVKGGGGRGGSPRLRAVTSVVIPYLSPASPSTCRLMDLLPWPKTRARCCPCCWLTLERKVTVPGKNKCSGVPHQLSLYLALHS